MQETQVRSLSWGDSLEKGMATHFSIFAWRIPWTEEPGGLQSLGSWRVKRDWAANPLHCQLNRKSGAPSYIPQIPLLMTSAPCLCLTTHPALVGCTVTTDEPVRIAKGHSVHEGWPCCTHYGFGQCAADMRPPSQYHTGLVHFPNTPLHPVCSPLLPATGQPLISLRSLQFFPFPECRIVGIIHSVATWDWLLSSSDMPLRFPYVFSWLHSSFLFSTETYYIVWRYLSLFIHSPPKEHLGCFQFAVIMNKAALDVCEQVFMCI